jgi:hypothetical protein
VILPAQDLAAILAEVRRLSEITREHKMRYDKQGEYTRELRFKEESDPTPDQKWAEFVWRGLLRLMVLRHPTIPNHANLFHILGYSTSIHLLVQKGKEYKKVYRDTTTLRKSRFCQHRSILF